MRVDKSIFKDRRAALKTLLERTDPKIKNKFVLLFSNFSNERLRFRQESGFQYLTGIAEPGAVFLFDLNENKTVLFLPNTEGERKKWLDCIDETTSPNQLGLDMVTVLGDKITGYEFDHFFSYNHCKNLISHLTTLQKEGGPFFCMNPPCGAFEQKFFLERLNQFVPGFFNSVKDISLLLSELRSKKEDLELENIKRAIEITINAQLNVASSLKNSLSEYELHAIVEHTFISQGSHSAFPSIIASGKNATFLHYDQNNTQLKKGDLVIVDIGAEYGGYAADLTRTYPVSGKFSDRQKEIYNLVLETQTYIASIAKPGYYLNNPQAPTKSLNHLAHEFLKSKSYNQYFPHAVGHYLGMDVHDIGDYKKPLEPGNVFTIEPGIYIKDECLGIRIEDDYLMQESGVVCLSEKLPKKIEDIEEPTQS